MGDVKATYEVDWAAIEYGGDRPSWRGGIRERDRLTMLMLLHDVLEVTGLDKNRIVIVGGAVRDAMLRRPPIDYDIYLLGVSIAELGELMDVSDQSLPPATDIDDWRGDGYRDPRDPNARYLFGTFSWSPGDCHNFPAGATLVVGRDKCKVQLCCHPELEPGDSGIERAIRGVDINICQYAFDANGIIHRVRGNEYPRGPLAITDHHSPHLTTIRRLFHFQDRYHFPIDLYSLHRAMLEAGKNGEFSGDYWKNKSPYWQDLDPAAMTVLTIDIKDPSSQD